MATRKAPAEKATTKKVPARNYDKPELRERLKGEITRGDKGGRPGQWSARKAQLLAHAYEAAGGGYTGPKTEAQSHLDKWTEEDWQTSDHGPAERGETTTRYLTKKAWDALTPAQKKATNEKKAAGSKRGEQFVANTPKAAKARRTATKAK